MPSKSPARLGAAAAMALDVGSLVLGVAALLVMAAVVRRTEPRPLSFLGRASDVPLVTEGPFARVRYPLYAALILLVLATALLHVQLRLLPTAIIHAWVGAKLRGRTEDAWLARRYGELFAAYAERVPPILPRLRRARPAAAAAPAPARPEGEPALREATAA